MDGAGLDVAALSDVGTERERNEDHAGHVLDGARALVAVADGVSGQRGGQTASRMAVEVLLAGYAEQAAAVAVDKRLYRAFQRANIEIHDLALMVPELRGMATTLTALVVDGSRLYAAHVGDTRLYRWRAGGLTQLSKDHTVAAERARLGLMSAARARRHADRSILNRSLGRELIVAVNRISTELAAGDVLLLCSDGLYHTLDDAELAALVDGRDAATACRALIDAANERGTADNLTAAVVRAGAALPPPRAGLVARLRRWWPGT